MSEDDELNARSSAPLPDGLVHVRTTPVFDQHSVPQGLLGTHQIAAGVWGNLIVIEGSIDFVFEDIPAPLEGNRRTLGTDACQAIPPERPHRVVVTGPVRFAIEFHRP